MKKNLIYILAAVLPLTFGICEAQLHAQDYVATPVSVSTEKVKLGGKLFYSHIVLEKQTIFSISKAYNTSVDEIYAANPGLKESGLKKNAIILIPLPSAEPEVRQTEEAASKEPEATAKTIQNDNSGKIKEKSVQEEEQPESKQDRKKKNRTDNSGYIIHTVRWFEDLDVISEKYGVPVDMIMEINDLSGRKLKNRQKLRIPADIDKYIDSAQDKDNSAAIDNPTENPAENGRKSLKEPLFP